MGGSGSEVFVLEWELPQVIQLCNFMLGLELCYKICQLLKFNLIMFAHSFE